MNTSAFRHRSTRLGAVLSGVFTLVLVLGAAGSPSRDAGAGTRATGPAHTSGSGGTWGNAEEVPGTATLNKGGFAAITSVSCASVGNCGAGGYYMPSNRGAGLVVGETKGTWGTAKGVPGTTSNSQSVLPGISSVSCASAGNCSAGGNYTDSSGKQQAFVAGERNGTWDNAEEVPGTATLNTGGNAAITSVSCASAGNCSAGGYYKDSSGKRQAFVAGERNGTWDNAEEVPGTATLNTGGKAQINSVSCASAENCSAGGYYEHKIPQAFVVRERNGTWGDAEEVPGFARLNTGRVVFAGTLYGVSSVSCASAGNCSAGGEYSDSSGKQQAFVAGERNGTWANAEEVPGSATLNKGGYAQIDSVSCASAGNCSAGGYVGRHALVVSETNGIWGNAEEIPGSLVNKGGYAAITSMSCASAGNCSAGGGYADFSGQAIQAFVITETHGTWGKAEEVPGTATLNKGGFAAITSVSCAAAGNCSAGGYYTGRIGSQQALVVNET
jgi:cytochrome c551/c552